MDEPGARARTDPCYDAPRRFHRPRGFMETFIQQTINGLVLEKLEDIPEAGTC